ncbi:uracil phosphoribosyltransferase-domain-containing protein [Umbelopsis sp. PMI_123]|nr:uracil phosphoribosyltransferase-domain-containing protein [Umbelopsis sp. PMI_123]
MSPSMTNLHVSSHPIVATKLTILRDKTSSSKVVRDTMRDLTLLLGYEATQDLELKKGETLQSPLDSYQGDVLNEDIAIVPILRSGLGFVEGMLNLIPEAHVLHLGLFREKISLQPVEYYNKLPSTPNVNSCIVLDPMIATGNTAIAAVHILKEWGIPGEKIRFMGLLASRQGVENLLQAHPDISIYLAAVDEELDSHGYIRPGIGDSGDRLWNTHV